MHSSLPQLFENLIWVTVRWKWDDHVSKTQQAAELNKSHGWLKIRIVSIYHIWLKVKMLVIKVPYVASTPMSCHTQKELCLHRDLKLLDILEDREQLKDYDRCFLVKVVVESLISRYQVVTSVRRSQDALPAKGKHSHLERMLTWTSNILLRRLDLTKTRPSGTRIGYWKLNPPIYCCPFAQTWNMFPLILKPRQSFHTTIEKWFKNGRQSRQYILCRTLNSQIKYSNSSTVLWKLFDYLC